MKPKWVTWRMPDQPVDGRRTYVEFKRADDRVPRRYLTVLRAGRRLE